MTDTKPSAPAPASKGWRLALAFLLVAVAVSFGLAWSMGLIGSQAPAEDQISDANVAVAEEPYPLELPDLADDSAVNTAATPIENAVNGQPAPIPETPRAKPEPTAKPKSILPARNDPIRMPVSAEVVRASAARARPTQALESLFARSDYPREARSARAEGTTAVTLGIDPAGRAITCRIAQSSGSVALDAATCRVLVSRARFSPAIDSTGVRTSDTYVQRIRWKYR